ncbi:MAG: hypothetical protein HC770_07325 [Pseudanabaena sp. CRU_2_10]|nr:hypothetical protein [Pseudanabaena sp. CRU_2_10]
MTISRIALKECCKDKGQDDLFIGNGTVTICGDDNKDFTYTGKGLRGINKQVDSLIELVSYGITELSDKVCEIRKDTAGCATCYLSIQLGYLFGIGGNLLWSSLIVDVPDKQPDQCQQIISFTRASLGSIWTLFNQAVRRYVDAHPPLPGESKSDIERLGLTQKTANYINSGLSASGGIMEASAALAVLSSIAQNTLTRLMIQPNPQKDGMVDIKVPDLFDGDGNLIDKAKITVTNLSGEGYEDAAKEAEADLNNQWANFTATIAKGLEDLTPPKLADSGGGGAIVPKGKSDIEKFGLSITIVRYLNQALKFTGKGLLIQIAKTILENTFKIR